MEISIKGVLGLKRWEEIYRVDLPLPFPLRTISSYVLAGKNGLTILDAGLNTAETKRVWEEFLSQHRFQWSDIEKIVISHYHPDHYGFAGEMQQLTGAPVYISEMDHQQATLFWGKESLMAMQMAVFFRKHGLAESLVAKIPEHLQHFIPWVTPHPADTIYLKAGEEILLGDRSFQILHTPGHADGHLSLLDVERGWLLAGDVLLPKITPNISLWPECDPNPLSQFLQTLQKLKKIPVTRVFPAHGDVFTHYQERIEQLERHHETRLQTIFSFIKEKQKCDAMTVCDFLFGRDLSIHNLRFAISETLAHLEYLVYKGLLDRKEIDGSYIYEING